MPYGSRRTDGGRESAAVDRDPAIGSGEIALPHAARRRVAICENRVGRRTSGCAEGDASDNGDSVHDLGAPARAGKGRHRSYRLEEDDAFLVTRRPGGVHLAGLWKFPGGRIGATESHADALRGVR